MRKIVIILASFILIWLPTKVIHAEETSQVQTYQNPPYHVINELLTKAALEKNIPPEIVKTIAFQESSWQQFVNGAPNISSDGGIGIMQVTNDIRFDQEKLKTDIQYNINVGIQKLEEKFIGKDGTLPKLNDNNRDVLESWYFAILAYNGKGQSNSPIIKDTGERNINAYQEKIFSKLDSLNNYMGIYPIPFDFNKEDFTYSGDPYYRLSFNKLNYSIPHQLLNETKHKFQANDIVLSAEGGSFRHAPTSSAGSIKTLPSGEREAITIMDKFVYDETYKYNSSIDMRYRQYVWYKTMLDDGRVAYSASGDLKPLGKRIYGGTRYETAVAISNEGWANGADTVVIANGNKFPDALAGTPLSYQLNAPLLLTNGNSLDESTVKEIKRLNAKNAVLLGGTGVISPVISNDLTNLGISVTRYGGADRFETAIDIANKMPNKGVAVLAYGYDFPDALAIAPYAAKNGYPIFLTRTGNIPSNTAVALANYSHVIVVGGEGVINPIILKELESYKQYGGINRFDTNAKIVNELKMGTGDAFVATGGNFADALTGAVLAAKKNAPLLLTYPGSVPVPIQNTIQQQRIDTFGFFGGKAVVGTENEIGGIVQNLEY
ncbi:cell wall-binding repeat-containing protein [Mesobacillus subterraneus]|uniref:cell wall-binding repeat-containing protein n=1 Tax=Mesobacillus subterraneus TaxID=285983 RepID=UPI00203D7AC7|nr:cell wall-binding repeat-containing protein [Mesobacillus subterraneus]MCM3683426.1 cell wall-binding repeat-containing protein [Mesobacillus subterraneus]